MLLYNASIVAKVASSRFLKELRWHVYVFVSSLFPLQAPRMNKHRIVKFPLTTESAMKKIEDNNTLVFIVDVKSNKRQIKDAVKALYDIESQNVNTLIRCVRCFVPSKVRRFFYEHEYPVCILRIMVIPMSAVCYE